ncbi:MAG: NAD(P)-dependent oxidoreductase [Armatimonadetes bacterium]|nr:NAD(P)-dependent oxidoreductase [Armatimonadota bacterium]
MKLLLTGGAGFLGYHVANDLAEHGFTSVLFDLAAADLGEYPAGTTAVVGDIRDRPALDRAIAEHRPDLVVHGAAALPLWRKRDILSVGVEGTRNVLEAALAAGIPRAVHISSTAVYGVPEKHPLFEADPMVGVGTYGTAKIGAEQVCAEVRAKGLEVAVVRPKTFIGTGRLGVFQILYDWVESGCRIPVIGAGTNRYQLLEVTDLVDAIRLCLTLPGEQANDVFNVGAKDFGTVMADVGALCDYAGSGASVMPTNAALVKAFLRVAEVLHLSPLYKWVYGTADTDSFVSTEKAESVLGWQPRYSNAEALTRSYQWYLEHKGEIAGASGITHRVAWRQGILGLVKKRLRNRRPAPR